MPYGTCIVLSYNNPRGLKRLLIKFTNLELISKMVGLTGDKPFTTHPAIILLENKYSL